MNTGFQLYTQRTTKPILSALSPSEYTQGNLNNYNAYMNINPIAQLLARNFPAQNLHYITDDEMNLFKHLLANAAGLTTRKANLSIEKCENITIEGKEITSTEQYSDEGNTNTIEFNKIQTANNNWINNISGFKRENLDERLVKREEEPSDISYSPNNLLTVKANHLLQIRDQENVSTTTFEQSSYSPQEEENNLYFQKPKLQFDEKEEEDDSDDEDFGVKRRGGFKKGKTSKIKVKSEAGSAAKNRSKAKHLWITYGRKIEAYAMERIPNEFKKKLDAYKNVLNSKKSYSETFMSTAGDSEEDKLFKKTFGKLAIQYLEGDAKTDFLSSNFRDELIGQSGKVADWIRRFI